MDPLPRPAAMGLLAVVLTSACVGPASEQAAIPSATAAPAPTASPAPSASPTPVGTPRVETSQIVLDLPIGPGYEQPAATTPGVGGLSSRGPMSLAVDREGRIYVWDQARVRILVYEGQRLAKIFPEPFIEQGATSLLAHGGRLYLRWAPNPQPFADYAIDATNGELVYVGLSHIGGTIYPRERLPLNSYDQKGYVPPIGSDALGNTYQRTSILNGYEIRRIDRSGAVRAVGTTATTDLVVDTYVAADGSVWDLRQSFGGALADRIRVVRLLAPGDVAPAEVAPPLDPSATISLRTAPSSVAITSAPELPPATLVGADARAFWWLMRSVSSDPYYATLPPPGAEAYRATLAWADASTLELVFNGSVTVLGRDRFGTSGLLMRALPTVLSKPSFAIDAIRANGARIRIPDVTAVDRPLTAAETSAFVDALGAAFGTTFYERYRPLEDPFPRRQLYVSYPGGSFALQDVGDRYLRGQRLYGLAMVHDGRASALLRQWLPTPAIPSNDPAILYTAEKVTLPDQDITRWKASIVRSFLLGPASQNIESGTPYDQLGPLTFTFTLPGGRTEVVRVDANGFTFAGRTYERTGLLGLHGLKGVP